MRRWPAWVVAVLLMATWIGWRAKVAHSQTAANPGAEQHKAVAPSEMKWGEPPPVFRKGAKMSVLYGDPMKAGSNYVLLLRLPANYKVMPHWHPMDENVTVMSGSLAVAMGDTFDPSAKALPAGSFFSMPAGMHHFAFAPTETTVQVTGIGPFKLIYVNPADDPSKERATR